MGFDKEPSILYWFFSLGISKNYTLLENSPNGAQKNFFQIFV